MTHHTFDLLVVALLVCAVLFYRHRWRRERINARLYERGLEVRVALRQQVKDQQKSIRNYVNQLRGLQDRADFMRMMGDSEWEHTDGIAHDGCQCNACYARRRVQEDAAKRAANPEQYPTAVWPGANVDKPA